MVAADLGIKTLEEMMVDLLEENSFHNVFHYRVHSWTDQMAVACLVDAAALLASKQYLRTARTVRISEFFDV